MLITEPKTEALEKLWHTRQCENNLHKDQAMDVTSNLKDTLERIDEVIAGYKTDITKGEDLKALQSNPLFKSLILEGFISTEAMKLFEILIDPSGASPYSEDMIRRKLDGIATVKGYMEDIKIKAESAPLSILREEQFRIETTANAARDEG